MIKIHFVPLMLAIILTVTIANLFYHPWVVSKSTKVRRRDKRLLNILLDPISASQCPLRGFKCASPEDCNCSKLCGSSFVPFQVEEGDNIVVVDKKIDEPGTYCLPEGVDNCNQMTSISIYSLSGWLCIPRNEAIHRAGKQVACKSDSAEDNNKNVLWDHALNREVRDETTDYYELLPQSTGRGQYDWMRYRCKCNSLDKHGNRMINALPFACSVDYCMAGLPRYPGLGWNGRYCNCGPFPHVDPLDNKSPCAMERTRIENNVLHGKVECTTNDAFDLKAWYCPPDRQEIGLVSFQTNAASTTFMNPKEFIEICLRQNLQVS